MRFLGVSEACFASVVDTGEEFLSYVNGSSKWCITVLECFISVNDTAAEFLTVVNDTGIASCVGVNDTAKFWFRGVNDTDRTSQMLNLSDNEP